MCQLMRKNTDKRFRRWVLSSLIGHTYYHNFVTHLREAWYQREAMNIIEQGGAVNAETLSGIFRKNLETFWGDAVELTEGCELTWMRQPHYYMGLYSYTYSAGLTLATQAALNIAAEGESAVARWRAMLEAGSTRDPPMRRLSESRRWCECGKMFPRVNGLARANRKGAYPEYGRRSWLSVILRPAHEVCV